MYKGNVVVGLKKPFNLNIVVSRLELETCKNED